MTILVTTKALNNGLVTLADLKVAIAPGDDDDTFLTSLIERVSTRMESITNRRFAREAITETINGSGRTDIMLSRFPIVNISEIRFNDSAIDSSEYKQLGSGILFREAGWTENLMVAEAITVNPLNMPGDISWEFDYTSGFLLPTDDFSSTLITADASGKTFTLSSGSWPLFVDGDSITFSGWADSDLNITFTIASRTAAVVTVDETVANEAEGQTIAVVAGNRSQRVPDDLEDACIDSVNTRFGKRSKDGTIKSEKIGDWSVSYDTGAGKNGLSDYAMSILNDYKVRF